jgi:hypothetical protein
MHGVRFRKGEDMPERTEYGPVALVCDDCPREFTGTATYTIIRLGEETGMERKVLDRVVSKCPRDPFHKIRVREP